MAKKNTKRLLFMEDLYDFYSNRYKRSTHFSAEKSGHQIFVQVPAEFEVDKNADYKDESLLFCKVKLMHSGENRNHSSVTDEALKKASKTMAYKPVLANFMEYEDEETGETLKDFTSHDMELNDDGSVNYIEKQVGCFTSDKPFFEVEKETGHNFLYGYCAIPVDYTDAASIIERKNGTKISVELAVNEMEYSGKNKILELTDVVIMGATLLGKDPDTKKDIGEGMLNARLDIADFNAKNNSLFSDYDSTLIDLQERLEKLESVCFNNKNDISGKEETIEVEKEKFEEEVTETVEVTETEETTEEEVTVTENESEKTVDKTSEETTENAEEDLVENTQDETTDTGVTENESVNPEKYSVTMSDGSVKEFSLSLDEITMSLYNLVNQMYGEADNAYYGVTVYEDNTLIMSDYWNGKYYRQSFNRDGDNFSLVGDRVAVHSVWVTDEEDASLNDMRSNYSSVVEELNTYKSAEVFADKMTVFDDEAYSEYLDTDEFKALMSEDSVNKYSKEELSEKADATLGKLVKKNKTFSFAGETPQKKHVSRVAFNAEKETEDTYKPYGDLFD
ncbi:hypothetical protein DWZ63_10315 [Clostridium sp. AF34-13]|uniref:hypothetical protein n=1 Tax=Clostridium sp. AF34-13 TaxID=2293012 RepID=UPI000E4A9B37|nr:hypothetical protein [Clostridium sp. AF34-13]RHP24345.1 hypothetical protein DWZ63_10315 [Clostridium sp. AF34-13]